MIIIFIFKISHSTSSIKFEIYHENIQLSSFKSSDLNDFDKEENEISEEKKYNSKIQIIKNKENNMKFKE